MCNLVAVSSIVPPGCELLTKEKGLKMIHPGEITFVVIARNATNEPHRQVAASVGVAIPSGKNQYGYLSEHHSFGETDEVAGDYRRRPRSYYACYNHGYSVWTLKPLGMNANNFSKQQAWSSKHQTLLSQRQATKTGFGQQPLLQQFFVPPENGEP